MNTKSEALRLLKADEAADYLATTERHLRRLVATEGLAVVHLREAQVPTPGSRRLHRARHRSLDHRRHQGDRLDHASWPRARPSEKSAADLYSTAPLGPPGRMSRASVAGTILRARTTGVVAHPRSSPNRASSLHCLTVCDWLVPREPALRSLRRRRSSLIISVEPATSRHRLGLASKASGLGSRATPQHSM